MKRRDESGLVFNLFRGERKKTLSAEREHHDPSYVIHISGSEMEF